MNCHDSLLNVARNFFLKDNPLQATLRGREAKAGAGGGAETGSETGPGRVEERAATQTLRREASCAGERLHWQAERVCTLVLRLALKMHSRTETRSEQTHLYEHALKNQNSSGCAVCRYEQERLEARRGVLVVTVQKLEDVQPRANGLSNVMAVGCALRFMAASLSNVTLHAHSFPVPDPIPDIDLNESMVFPVINATLQRVQVMLEVPSQQAIDHELEMENDKERINQKLRQQAAALRKLDKKHRPVPVMKFNPHWVTWEHEGILNEGRVAVF